MKDHRSRQKDSKRQIPSFENNPVTSGGNRVLLILILFSFFFRKDTIMVVQVAFLHKLTLFLLSINSLFAFDREKIIQDFEKVREHYRKEKRRPPIHSDDSRHRRELFDPVESEPLLADHFGGTPGFYHSVASGDPLPDAVIIWSV